LKSALKILESYVKKLFLTIAILCSRKPECLPLRGFTAEDKVLFIRLNRIGDALVTTGLISSIKRHTGCAVHVLADEKNYFVFRSVPGIDKIFVYQKKFRDQRDLLKSIRLEHYTVIVDTHDDVSTTVSFVVRSLRAAYKFALNKSNASLFTHTVPKPNAADVHIVDRMAELSTLFGFTLPVEERGVVFRPSDTARHKAVDFLEKRFPNRKFLLALNISAGDEARFWGILNFKRFFETLASLPVDVMLLSTTRDLKYAFRMTDNKDIIFYTPVFEEFAAMMEHIDLLFSPDTATVHLASVYRKPVFGLYVQYNTTDRVWSPYHSDFESVITKDATLHQVTVDEVLGLFIPFLQKYIRNDSTNPIL
jgi:ADP-heptose:LPS heptosyltransferase